MNKKYYQQPSVCTICEETEEMIASSITGTSIIDEQAGNNIGGLGRQGQLWEDDDNDASW